MSLEAALAENTATMKQLIAALAAKAVHPVETAVTAAKETVKAAAEARGVDIQQSPAKPQEEKKPEAPPAASAEPPKELDYERDVKPKALAFAKAKGRDALVALLGEFGAKGAAEVPAAKFGEFVGKIDAALAQG